jgi:Flp pilus assembly protein TadB
MRIIRGVLVALALALAGVLVARGDVVVGALIGTMAIIRAVLFTRVRRRRERFRQYLARSRGYPV